MSQAIPSPITNANSTKGNTPRRERESPISNRSLYHVSLRLANAKFFWDIAVNPSFNYLKGHEKKQPTKQKNKTKQTNKNKKNMMCIYVFTWLSKLSNSSISDYAVTKALWFRWNIYRYVYIDKPLPELIRKGKDQLYRKWKYQKYLSQLK